MLTHGNQFIGNLPNIRALEYTEEEARKEQQKFGVPEFKNKTVSSESDKALYLDEENRFVYKDKFVNIYPFKTESDIKGECYSYVIVPH